MGGIILSLMPSKNTNIYFSPTRTSVHGWCRDSTAIPPCSVLRIRSLNLNLLAETAGLEVIGETTQRLDRPHPATLVGSGKLEEIKMLIEDSLADVVLFDTELSPRHQRELEELIGPPVKVIDRTASDPGYFRPAC